MHTTATMPTFGPRNLRDRASSWPPNAARPVSDDCDPASAIIGTVALVCFPVALTGGGLVIPFGRYDIATSRQDRSRRAASRQVVLRNRDDGTQILLSAEQWTAIARDPDVVIL